MVNKINVEALENTKTFTDLVSLNILMLTFLVGIAITTTRMMKNPQLQNASDKNRL